MQKHMEKVSKSEIDSLILAVIGLGKSLNINIDDSEKVVSFLA